VLVKLFISLLALELLLSVPLVLVKFLLLAAAVVEALTKVVAEVAVVYFMILLQYCLLEL
jgi:hypothetical protein